MQSYVQESFQQDDCLLFKSNMNTAVTLTIVAELGQSLLTPSLPSGTKIQGLAESAVLSW